MLRDLCPALSGKTYFNYGGQGPLPDPSLDAITASWKRIQQLGPFTTDVWPCIGAEVNSTDDNMDMPLHWAASRGVLNIVIALLNWSNDAGSEYLLGIPDWPLFALIGGGIGLVAAVWNLRDGVKDRRKREEDVDEVISQIAKRTTSSLAITQEVSGK